MVHAFLPLLFGGAALLAVWLLWKDWQITQRERMRVHKFRGSPLYARMYPTLCRLKLLDIEAVSIRPDAISFTLMGRPDKRIRFTVEEAGMNPLSINQMLAAAQALENDIEVLGDHRRYRLRRQSDVQANGSRLYRYQYVIRHNYKEAISRAPYYEKVA